MIQVAQVECRAPKYKDVLMCDAGLATKGRQTAIKRRNTDDKQASQQEEQSTAQDQDAPSMIAYFQEQFTRNDEQLQGTQKTIDALNERIQSTLATLERMERQLTNGGGEQENL